ncbi:hypothetical protein N7447_008633 [Penicillium robsamsonii]|uniref:uncharacterized protein n=1 Tax=Penicillium robsamsonii TaxID=1792511 RepID=UPI002549A7B8|nr:uncharacterized protein N7447_008633 [Penicillium robsamsonii]KAJ5816400.1 hypothetical protein N7447_008633 [Penicillium robsamsonii]
MTTTNLQDLNAKMQALIEHVSPTSQPHTPPRRIFPNTSLSYLSQTKSMILTIRNRAFESHPQCRPPNTHPTIFFLYDFVRNSFNQLMAVDADKYAAGDSGAKTTVDEVEGRNGFANMLINDTSGKLSMMTGGNPSNPADFGAEIKAKALALTQ